MVVRMRHTKGHTANRRSHHALENPGLVMTSAGTMRRSHHMDPVTGTYRGRIVIDVTKRAQKLAEKNSE